MGEYMRVIIYGIGKRYYQFFNYTEFIKKGVIEKDFQIVGFADSNRQIWNSDIVYNGYHFKIKCIGEFQSIDKIIVTTNLYFDEIKNKLIKKGYKKEQILLIDQLFEKYLDEVFDIQTFIGKTGLEIGGPTKLFFNIYKQCTICDNVNFSKNTVWCKHETNDYKYKDRIIGKNWIADAINMYQIESEKYDFVLSSNNLEHIANPLKALGEFSRVVKKGAN